MDIREYIESLKNRMENREYISVEELRNYIKVISVEDENASENATTIMHNGEYSSHMEHIAASSGDSVRMIERTKGYELLHERAFKQIVEYAIRCDELNELGYSYEDEVGAKADELLYGESADSFMSIIASRFAAETKGDVYITPEALSPNSSFVQNILPVFFDCLPYAQKICGIMKEDLSKFALDEKIKRLSDIATGDFSNSKVYFDSNGNIIARTLENTPLEGILPSANVSYSGDYSFVTDYNHYRNYRSESEVRSMLGPDSSLFVGDDMLRAQELVYSLDYEAPYVTDVAGSIDNGNIDISPILNGTSNTTGDSVIDSYAKVYADYLQGSGKNIDELTDVDKKLINYMCDLEINRDNSFVAFVNDKINFIANNKRVKELLSKINFDKVGAVMDVADTVLGVLSSMYEVYTLIPNVAAEYEKGNMNEAAAILVGGITDTALTLVSGMLASTILVPIFTGVGFSVAGPVGAAIGAYLGGAASDKIGEIVGDAAGEFISDLTELFGMTADLIEFKGREVWGDDQENVLHGDEKNNYMYGKKGNDRLFGNDGDDHIEAGSGDDELSGGKGDDYLDGGEGNDTYVFSIGDGEDSIMDFVYEENAGDPNGKEGRQDTIAFGPGITKYNIDIQRKDEFLVIKYGQGDEVTVLSAYRYRNGWGLVENITFADGVKLDVKDIANMANQLHGDDEDNYIEGFEDAIGYNHNETIKAGAGDDSVYAYTGNDVIYGEAGDDTLYGETGDDELYGGTGDDELDGGEGNDTYFFNKGDGIDVIKDWQNSETEGKADRIVFGKGITLDNVSIQRNYSDLIIKYGDGDKVIVKDAYLNSNYFVENIEFADGTKLTTKDIANIANKLNGIGGSETIRGYKEAVGYNESETIKAGEGNDKIFGGTGDDTLYGEAGNDELYGEVGNDTLIGGKGTDKLNGGEGNDTYVFNIGDGIEVIEDYEYSKSNGKADKILFGEGITLDSVDIQRVDKDLVIKYGEGDQVTVKSAYTIIYLSNSDGSSEEKGMYLVENIEFADGTKLDADAIANIANQLHGTEEADNIRGYQGTIGYNENETIKAGEGDDVLIGEAGNDILYGEDGNDTLYGSNGDDTLNGGKGNDILNGGEGNDTYVFNIGDGVDVITDYEYSKTEGKADKIVFGEGITLESVDIQRVDKDLVIKYGEGDQVTVKSAYTIIYLSNSDGSSEEKGMYLVENIEFADGTKLDADAIANIANQLHGTEEADNIRGHQGTIGYNENETIKTGAGDDVLIGEAGNDVLYGEGGNDTLYGSNGDDTLYGAIGNDTLNGGEGNDTYVFNIGDGIDVIEDYEYSKTEGKADKIVFGEGITLESVDIQRVDKDLVIKYGEGDQVTVKSAYTIIYMSSSDGSFEEKGMYLVENIEFADGTKLDVEAIANIANQLHGTDESDTIYGYGETIGYNKNETIKAGAGDDILYGDAGNDTLYGETGNDNLNGGAGNDTYVFNLGDGVDVITDYENSETEGKADKIVFGEGITLESVDIRRVGKDLVIKYGEGDQVTVKSAYNVSYISGSDGSYEIKGMDLVENIEFADGTKLDVDEIANIANQLYGTDEADNIRGYQGTIGYNENETIHGGAGDDALIGESGNDTLYGESGNDTLYGSDGNDILNGGIGNDTLNGGIGDDAYVFNLGDGVDVIYDYENSETEGKADKIVFGEGITRENVDIRRVGKDLVIKYGEGDQVTVKSAYNVSYISGSDGSYEIKGMDLVENIEFADGTKLDVDEIANIANQLYGTDEADNIRGYQGTIGYNENETIHGGAGDDALIGESGNDTLYGESGNDTLYGSDGNDTLYGGIENDTLNGGVGNDVLYGGSGNDIYVFSKGDGIDIIRDYEDTETEGKTDKIKFGSGITLDRVDIQRKGSNLVINYGEGDCVIVENAYSSNGNNFIENIEFSNGKKLTADNISVMVNSLSGTAYSDVIKGREGSVGYNANEIFKAGVGDDRIYGGTGDDTYIFNKGDGVDVIYDYENSETEGKADKIVFGEGITKEDLELNRVGDSLVINYGQGDYIIVMDSFAGNGEYQVENIEFADGSKEAIDYANVQIKNENESNEGQSITIASCVEELHTVYASNDGAGDTVATEQEDEEVTQLYDAGISIDNMVNQLVQDMSETSTLTVSDSTALNNDSINIDTSALWD